MLDGFSSIIRQATNGFISKFSKKCSLSNISLISHRAIFDVDTGILDSGARNVAETGPIQFICPLEIRNKRKSKKTDREEDRGNFYKIVIRNGEIRSSGIRSCSFIFYSVAITPDSKSRQSCARQLRDPRTFP